MAVKVGYFQDNYDGIYDEGPFVLVDAFGWRIEQEGPTCPYLPDSSIYELRKLLGWTTDGKTNDTTLAEKVCDELNAMVKRGEIVNKNGLWVW
ncbi:MAG TPA: hypothetical protein VH593_08625 [Ktedonobacteraceae bacterium]|jgi:hypothetical protein